MIYQTTIDNFNNLKLVIGQLSAKEYTTPLKVLNGSTIGMHIRHILEFYQCLMEGKQSGEVNYDDRRRDKMIESDPGFALGVLGDIADGIDHSRMEIPMKLLYNYDTSCHSKGEIVPTSLRRELIYNLEHLIHHLAIIKIGIQAMKPDLLLDKNFGVAVSTVRNNNLCAQ
ncbi:DinB family protein [Robertkochia solimangrovi]|uniref:DinB family protein n=1 Tax=Robertkochia solimangrovi TaxID=2213046 RepID=UPI00117E9FCB|nr:DinB family protein [Robertkochia solimangrovi]TRZ42795.1 DinB family protein [Robertkochia solimangrovi]